MKKRKKQVKKMNLGGDTPVQNMYMQMMQNMMPKTAVGKALQLINNKNGEISMLKGNQNLMFQKMLKMFTENDQLIKMRNVLIQNLNKEKKINEARNLKIRTEKGKSSPMRRGGRVK